MKKQNEYSVSVGNIGNIEVNNKREATKMYNEYVRQSKAKYGRASGEDVTLWINGEPVKDYFGTLNQGE